MGAMNSPTPATGRDPLATFIAVGSLAGKAIGFVVAAVLLVAGALAVAVIAAVVLVLVIAMPSSAGKVEYRTRPK